MTSFLKDAPFKGSHGVYLAIKLAVQETGLGSEWVRAPRLPLVGAERKQILGIIHQGIKTRPRVPKH